MNEKIYNNFFKLITEAKVYIINHSSKILSCDDPRRLLIGFVCEQTGKHFYIRIGDIKRNCKMCSNGFSGRTIANFLSLCSTWSGRKQIADFINTENNLSLEVSNYIDRMRKLNAFW